jgi:hypothetical protein
LIAGFRGRARSTAARKTSMPSPAPPDSSAAEQGKVARAEQELGTGAAGLGGAATRRADSTSPWISVNATKVFTGPRSKINLR